MSGDARTGADLPSATEQTTNYEKMLDTLDVAIDEAKYKIENGRVRSPENEKVRIKWVRALAYALNVRRQIAHDRDLEELAEKMDALEQQQENRL
jgi:hypothetical protein